MNPFSRWLRKLDGPLFDDVDEVRPRFGHIDHRDGTRTPLRFLPTSDPLTFQAVTLAGKPAYVVPGEPVSVDVLGAGQTVRISVKLYDQD